MTTPLGRYFTLEELTRSETALRRGIPNVPTERQVACLAALVKHVLDPAREALGPIHVNSGFRSKALNWAIGGAKNSAHQIEDDEAAADLDAPLGASYSNLDLFAWLAKNAPFCKLIDEFDLTWVHVSYRRGGAQDGTILRAYHQGGRTIYAPVPRS